MKKIIIHPLKIGPIKGKIQFQIKLPQNTKSVESIMVTGRFTGGEFEPDSYEVGSISLRVPEKQNVFFSEVVRFPQKHVYGRYYYGGTEIAPFLYLDRWCLWSDGKRELPFSISVDGSTTIIEGFYTSDYVFPTEDNYTVNIYLTLEI